MACRWNQLRTDSFYRDCLVLKQMLHLLVLFLELPEDPGPVCYQHHFLWRRQGFLTGQTKRQETKAPVTTVSIADNWRGACGQSCWWYLPWAMSSSMASSTLALRESSLARSKSNWAGDSSSNMPVILLAKACEQECTHSLEQTSSSACFISLTHWWLKSRSNQAWFHPF